MGEEYCDLGLGLAIGGCEFKPISNHDSKQIFGQHNILFPPRVKEIRDREVEVTSRREGGNIKRPKPEESSVAKDLSDSAGDDSSSSLTRKKLRLTKEQSSLLEDSFRSQQIPSSV
jgi:homeobox-leucine zipper protein